MAEIEEAMEAIEEAEEGIAEAGAEEELEEEVREEIVEAAESVEEIKEDASFFKRALEWTGKSLVEFVKFTVKTAAIGAILFGVNTLLTKINSSPKATTGSKRKQEVIKAILDLIKSERDICKALSDWMKAHKDDTIELDGITIPLESVFVKYLNPISDAVDKAYEISNKLQKKIGGKVSWDVPTADDISHLINVSAQYIKAFEDLQKFAADNVSKVPDLKTLPISDKNITDLKQQLDTIKKMPLYETAALTSVKK